MKVRLLFIVLVLFYLIFVGNALQHKTRIDHIIRQNWDSFESSNLFKKIKTYLNNSEIFEGYYPTHETHCDHDHYMHNSGLADRYSKESRAQIEELGLGRPFISRKRSELTWEPMKIKAFTQFINSSDPYSCHKVGQEVVLDIRYYNERLGQWTDRYTCTSNDILTTDKQKLLKNYIIPTVLQIVEEMILVPYEGQNLVLDPEYHKIYGTDCRTGVEIPDYLINGAGEPNANYILFFSARPMPQPKVLANANPCSHQIIPSNRFGRPLAGSINFNPGSEDLSMSIITNPFLFDKVVKLGLHEITHALGFSQHLFADYQNDNGEFYGSTGPLISLTTTGPTIYKFSGPRVVAFAKEHFSCGDSNFDGVELEEWDTTGTGPGSHWEKRLVGSEYMAAITSISMPISLLTLSLLEDSGWYRVNYSYSQDLRWGHKQGCDFLSYPCTKKSWEDYFCTTTSKSRHACNPEKTAKGYCTLQKYPSVLGTYYQHFEDGFYGGDYGPDYCPTWKGYSNYYCEDVSVPSRFQGNSFGETFGTGSACFDLKLTDGSPETACWQVQCVNGPYNKTRVGILVGDTWYGCPINGTAGWISLHTPQGKPLNAYCPESNFFCREDHTVDLFLRSYGTKNLAFNVLITWLAFFGICNIFMNRF